MKYALKLNHFRSLFDIELEYENKIYLQPSAVEQTELKYGETFLI
jgi:hypothetical protein